MLNGLYSAAAGMAAQQERLDALANDIANVNTAGYKQARLGFRDLLYNVQGGVRVGAGAALVDIGRNFAAGAFRQVDEPLSLAIDGPGFFQVRRNDGSVGLTRDGAFELDGNGSLVTSGGERLIPPVTLPRGARVDDVRVAPNGAVTVGGRRIGTVVVVNVTAPARLVAAGGNVFVPTAASGAPQAAGAAAVRQGYVEMSNVDFAESMVNVLDAQRSFELNSKVIQTQDQLMEIANGIRR